MNRNLSASLVLAAIWGAGFAHAQETAPLSAEGLRFFETRIRPVLAEKCYQCHSEESGKFSGGLRLDTREGLLAGGDSGPAIEAGNPSGSLLIEAIQYGTEGLQMPPPRSGGRLDADVVADFEQWISIGAPDPREGTSHVPESGAGEETRNWWAFQPVRPVSPPQTADRDWPKSDIDRFVLHGLESRGIAPVADAGPLALLRRVTFDLTGLPPDPEVARKFSAEWTAASSESERDAMYAAAVDGLLASPRFGERWGRYWLDVARYSESSGKDVNILFPLAWRYRDWVIDAFNADLPYDRFICEQLAGDLLPSQNEAEKSRQLIATGFLAIGPKSLNEQQPQQFVVDLADEQLDAVTQSVMGLTVACARCHDHKFDPVSQKDYTALAGIFLSTDTRYGTGGGVGGRNAGGLVELPEGTAVSYLPAIERSEYEAKLQRVSALEKELRDLQAERIQSRRSGSTADNSFSFVRVTTQLSELRSELKNYNSDGSVKPMAMGAVDKPAVAGSATSARNGLARRRQGGFTTLVDSPLFIRGETDRPSEKITRAIPGLFEGLSSPAIPRSTSGRKELAEWMTDPDHPLTSRVMVNRIWHWLFGAGIVTSVDNFGNSGSEPTHPELLDWLASRFVTGGWSVKSLVREIVLSRTYRLSTTYSEDRYLADPANALLWRHSPRRLDAEAIRDSILTASGKLDLNRPEASLIGRAGDGPLGGPRRSTVSEDRVIKSSSYVRSVYMATGRNAEPELLAVFDFPDAAMVQGARQSTNVPSQTLYLLNSDFAAKQAAAIAERVVGDVYGAGSGPAEQPASGGPARSSRNSARRGSAPPMAPAAPAAVLDNGEIADQLTEMYWITLGRPPEKAEISAAKKLLAGYRRDPMAGWTSVARGLIASAEFRGLD